MVKSEIVPQVAVKFVDHTEVFNARQEKVFDLSSLIPEIKKYQLISNPNTKHNVLNNNCRYRTGSCSRIVAKKKSPKIPTVFMKLATIPRPNVLHSYLSHSDIMLYFDYLKVRFADFVKIHTLGLSFERRPIKCIEINWNNERNLFSQAKENRAKSAPVYIAELKHLEVDANAEGGRNIVFIEGGTHAREWISITVALNCIHQLTERNVRHRDLLRKLKFYIVALVNPDGYEYARNTNPRWRKNRRPHSHGEHVGTDCNRNFDFHWDECRSKAKRNTYQGEKPFSEPETRALATILHKLSPKLLLFLSLHSYAQSIMYPWGYSKLLPKNVKLMENVAIAGRNAIKAFSGRYYRVGSISQITKRTIAGSVVDYAYGAVKIPLTLVMELPANEYGFQPPPEKINSLGNESWHGIREMCKKAYSLKAHIDKEEKEKLIVQKENLDSNILTPINHDDNSIKSQNNLESEPIKMCMTSVASGQDRTTKNVLENVKMIKPQLKTVAKGKMPMDRPTGLIGGHISCILDVMF